MSKTIPKSKEITDFRALPFFFHDKKKIVLQFLIKEKMNIKALADKTKMNPGTVRRHLDDLIEMELVELTETVKNVYGQKEKFYRATGKKFDVKIEFTWP